MIEGNSTMQNQVVYSDDRKYKYLLRKVWDQNKRKAMVLMIGPGPANEVMMDFTTMYVVNNLFNLGFGSVEIVNIFSKLNMSASRGDEGASNETNDKHIKQAAERADEIIIAWGRNGNVNQNIRKRQCEVIEMLSAHKEKMKVISDERGNDEFHPLAPQIRFAWVLKKYDTNAFLNRARDIQNRVSKAASKKNNEKKASKGTKTKKVPSARKTA